MTRSTDLSRHRPAKTVVCNRGFYLYFTVTVKCIYFGSKLMGNLILLFLEGFLLFHLLVRIVGLLLLFQFLVRISGLLLCYLLVCI